MLFRSAVSLVLPALLKESLYRYAMVAIPLACLAAGLAFIRQRPQPSLVAAGPPLPRQPDDETPAAYQGIAAPAPRRPDDGSPGPSPDAAPPATPPSATGTSPAAAAEAALPGTALSGTAQRESAPPAGPDQAGDAN